MRYVGQEYTVHVPYRFDPAKSSEENKQQLTELFHQMHLNMYGHNNPQGAVELVHLRVAGYGKLEKAEFRGSVERAQGEPSVRITKATVWNGQAIPTPVYTTETLRAGHAFCGPAIIEDASSTTVVPKGYRIELDAFGNLLIGREE
jgi:N-methylhydantoinase A